LGARVRIELDGGRNFEMEQEAPSGSGARPFDDRRKVVEDKFRRETRYTLRKERMEKAIDLIHHLEDVRASHMAALDRRCICASLYGSAAQRKSNSKFQIPNFKPEGIFGNRLESGI